MSNWQEETIGDCRLICADCRDVLPTLDLSRAVIVADPPYGIGKDYGPMTLDTLEEFVSAISLVHSTDRPSVVFIPVSRIFSVPERPSWWGVWNKTWGGYGLCSMPIFPHWEALAFYGLKGDFLGNKGHRSDVFTFSPVRPEMGGHPTPKPVDLMVELCKFLSFGDNDTIVDPFAGSGTTGIASISIGKKFTGIEIEERWFDASCRRIEQAYRQGDLFRAPPPKPVQEGLGL